MNNNVKIYDLKSEKKSEKNQKKIRKKSEKIRKFL